MRNISLNIFNEIKNIAKHLAHAKYLATFLLYNQTSHLKPS